MKKIITILLVFCSVLVFGQGATPNLRAGLIGYWKFEETSGTTSFDETAKNNDGTISGALINQTGKIGKCYDFDGSNDYVRVSSLQGNFNLAIYSVSLWLNADVIDGTTRLVFSYDGNDASYGLKQIAVKNTYGVSFNDGLGSESSTISTSTWYHIVAVAVADNDCKLYVDGELIGDFTGDDIKSSTPSSAPFTIAANRTTPTPTSNFFNGKIDELLLHSRGLAALEVAQLYNSDTGLLYVQENFKQNNNYNKLIDYVLDGMYLAWIN